MAGFDRGVMIPLAGSNGAEFTHEPWLSKPEQRRLTLLEHESARQRHARWACSGGKGQGRIGKNEQKAYAKISALRAEGARRREDWQHKVALEIANTCRAAAFEDLDSKNMSASAAGTVEEPGRNVRQKAGLNRVILNEAWGQLLNFVSYKMVDNGGVSVTVPASGTSQECHVCGSKAIGQRQSQALFQCLNHACGWSGNADFNAACNILQRALSGGLGPAWFGGAPNAARPGYEPGTCPSSGRAEASTGSGLGMRESQTAQRLVAA